MQTQAENTQAFIEEMSDRLILNEHYFGLKDPTDLFVWGYENKELFRVNLTTDRGAVEDIDFNALLSAWEKQSERNTIMDEYKISYPQFVWGKTPMYPIENAQEAENNGVVLRVKRVTNTGSMMFGRWKAIANERGLYGSEGETYFPSIDAAKERAETEAVKIIDSKVAEAYDVLKTFCPGLLH